MLDICKMAGITAAHSVYSVCDGELLIPIYGYLSEDGKICMTRLAYDSGEEAMQAAQEMYEGNPHQALGAALVLDGFITVKDVGKVDALLLKIISYAEPRRAMELAIPYRHAHSQDGFAVFKPKLTGVTGITKDELQPLIDAFYAGRDEHAEGSAVWKEKFQEQITGMSGFAGFSAEEWQQLREAPVAAFCMVASADGKIDAKEAEAFGKLFKASGKYPSVLMQRVMTELSPDTPNGRAVLLDFLQRFVSPEFSSIQYFARLNGLLARNASEDDAAAFKKDLLVFSTAVAESSGGFFGFGSKISKAEKQVLEAITGLLTSPPELSQLMADMATPAQ